MLRQHFLDFKATELLLGEGDHAARVGLGGHVGAEERRPPPSDPISPTVPEPPSSSMSATTTRAPSWASLRATALPIPAPAPVTMATFPRTFMNHLLRPRPRLSEDGLARRSVAVGKPGSSLPFCFGDPLYIRVRGRGFSEVPLYGVLGSSLPN